MAVTGRCGAAGRRPIGRVGRLTRLLVGGAAAAVVLAATAESGAGAFWSSVRSTPTPPPPAADELNLYLLTPATEDAPPPPCGRAAKPLMAGSLPMARMDPVTVSADANSSTTAVPATARFDELPPPNVTVVGNGSTFVLTLYGDWPANATAAVAAGARVWADAWQSAVPVSIGANWTDGLGGSLATTKAPLFLRGISGRVSPGGLPGAGLPDTLYGRAMLSAMVGEELISETKLAGLPPALRHAMNVKFDGMAAWYTGADADGVPEDEFDLATVMVHEIGHGLFFQGVLTASIPRVARPATERGAGGAPCADGGGDLGGRPTVRTVIGTGAPYTRFDSLLATRSPHAGALLPACATSPSQLVAALTAGDLAFVAPAVPGGLSLFAPAPLVPGSSVYHLDPARVAADCAAADLPDETTGTCGGAMTPTLARGRAGSHRAVGGALQAVMGAMMDDTVLPTAQVVGGGEECAVAAPEEQGEIEDNILL